MLKSLQKYINLTSIPKNKNKSRHKKDKLKTNKSANNIKITNKKYISTNDFKSETTKIKNKFESKDKIIENIGIKKNKSFINKLLNGFCCCNEIEDWFNTIWNFDFFSLFRQLSYPSIL